MKYTVYANYKEKEYTADFNLRSDAKLTTVARKCAETIYSKILPEAPEIRGSRWSFEKPNIWTNGGFMSLWMTTPADGVFDLHVDRDGIAFI